MATVLEKSTMRVLESVNTPDYPEKDYIINPDLSTVAGVPEKYWTIKDGRIEVLSPAEIAVIETGIIAEKEAVSPPCPYGLKDNCEYIQQ